MTSSFRLAGVRREWRLALSDTVTPLTLGLTAAITALALFAGWQRTQQRTEHHRSLKQKAALQTIFLESAFEDNTSENTAAEKKDLADELSPAEENRRQELQMSATSPDMMRYTEGIWWTMYSGSPLASLSTGASSSWPDSYRHAGSSTVQTIALPAGRNPLLSTLGSFDLTLVVGVILPLALIALTYNVIASEREEGRWPLVTLHATSFARLIIMRCLVRAVALWIVVIAFTGGFAVFVMLHQAAPHAVGNLIVWTLWSAAYLGFWAVLAIWVNTLRLSPPAAGLLLLFFWSILVIAIPAVVQRTTNYAFQMPSRAELQKVEAEFQQQAEEEREAIVSEFISQNRDVSIDSEFPQQIFLVQDVAMNRFVRLKVRQRLEEYFNCFLEREAFLDRCQFLSPLLAWRTGSDQSAGVSMRHYIRFAEQTTEFHNEYIEYFEPHSISSRELTRKDHDQIPQFNDDGLGTHLDATPLLKSAACISIWCGVFGWFGWWNLRRLEHI